MAERAVPWRVPIDVWKGQPAFLIGGGSSLKGTDFRRFYKPGARVFAINSAYTEVPEADILFFADLRWWVWNQERMHREWRGGRIVTRRAALPDSKVSVLNRTYNPISRDPDSIGGWCSGGATLNLAALMGCDPIFLCGYDMRPGNWHDLHQAPHKEGQHRDQFIPFLEKMEPHLTAMGKRVFNTNLNSALRCFPFIPLEEVLSMSVDELTKIEREKYLAVWARSEYRKVSPGMKECERAHAGLLMLKGETLIDFGSGPCRATKWFLDRGIRAVGVDFAKNANEFPDFVNVIEACLWEMNGRVAPADYGFCCDVLEHIPREKVRTVVEGIATRVTKGAWFRIATRADVMGPRLIGQPLHLTVETGDWWRRVLEDYFLRVNVVEDTGREIVLAVDHGVPV